MNSILRAVAARWPMILISTIACLIGGLWVVTTSQPRYRADARVILDYVRPDPETGTVIPSRSLDAYLTSQFRMIRDQSVAARAAEILGWMDSPDVLAAYANRPAADTRELGAWIAGILIPRTGARMLEDSNILVISYYGETPELSLAAAEALRTAYIESNTNLRRDTSRAAADRIQITLDSVRKDLAELEALQASVEAETGVVVGEKGEDQASERLRRMNERQDARVAVREGGPQSSAGALAQIEASIQSASQTMGPNNPALIRMMRQRDLLKAQMAAEGSSAEQLAAANVAASRASAAAYEALKAEVLATREPAMRLRLIQDRINSRQDEFKRLTESLVELRSQQTLGTTSMTPTGEVVAEPIPVFPNKILIFGGTGGLGLIFGSILACLSELLGRRVRTRSHLELATGVAMLVELPRVSRTKRRWRAEPRPTRASKAASSLPVGSL